MNGYMKHYQDTQFHTASPEKILIMLYDGAIRFCRQAVVAMDNNDKTVQNEKIARTMAIISEFVTSLNHEIGGEIARDLDALYGFILRELTRANVENDRKALETVDNLLSGLRDTWVEAANIYTKEQSMPREMDSSVIATAG